MMKVKMVLILGSLIWTLPALAAGERTSSGSRQISLGFASVTLTDLWSQKNNQSGTAWVRELCVGVNVEKPYMTEGLGKYQLSFLVPFKAGTAGLSISGAGCPLYQELLIGTGFARKLGPKFSAGIQLDYLGIYAGAGYGSQHLFSCEIGLLWKPASEMVLGIHLVNPYPVRIARAGLETLPASVTAGVSWMVTKDCTLLGEVEKMEADPLRIRSGIEYRVLRSLSLRTGFASQPWVFTFGAGLNYGKLSVDIASWYHPVLGFTPSCSLAYIIKPGL